jgi:predicted dehydrogenase
MIQEQKIGIGVLGCSDIARRRFLPALSRSRSAELTAVASRDAGKARECCKQLAEALDYNGLLTSPRVDLVYISLPNHLHEEWTLKALDCGKHVVCEKPLALDPSSAERMLSHAEKRGLLLYENIMYVHHPQHRKVRELIAAGAIGTIRALRAGFGFRLEQDGFRLKADQGGGAFHDLARYPLSAALQFLRGERYRFTGYSLMRGDLNVGMSACAITGAGELVTFSIGFEQQYECWYELLGDRGSLRVDRAFSIPPDLPNTIHLTAGTTKTIVPVAAADHFELMIGHVCGLLRKRTGFAEAMQQARRLSLIAEQAYAGCVPVMLGNEGNRS